jgi:hypothetical protein
MSYMTVEHKSPPRQVERNGLFVPTAPLIKRATDGDPAEREDARAKLAAIGVYWHVPDEGPIPPLGYTDYQLVGIEYRREPAGTPEERQAAADAQEAAALQARREGMQCTPIQGELALIRYGQQVGQDLIGGYDAWRTAQERTREERAWIERTQSWKRLDPNVLSGAAAVGIVEDALLDALFEMAATL